MDEFREYLKRRGKKTHVVEGLVLYWVITSHLQQSERKISGIF
jgi:hypothetical protein